MAIDTEIPLSEKETKVYKRFLNLSVNEEPKPQGEGTIRVSPFDDYFIFTIYDEVDGTNTPIDLSNVGTIYMVFIGENDEIRIPNYTNVENVDMSTGQVLFKVDSDAAKKILALDNRNFYISTMMTDPSGQSDESVLYTGTFLSFSEEPKVSLSAQLEEARLQYSREIAALQEQVEKQNADLRAKEQLINEQTVVINSLKESNQNLSNEVAILSEQLSSSRAEELLAEAKAAQAAEELAKLNRQQQNAKTSGISGIAPASGTDGIRKTFFTQAAEQLRKNIPGVNQVTFFSGTSGLRGVSGENGITNAL
jgi:hypothetical protein